MPIAVKVKLLTSGSWTQNTNILVTRILAFIKNKTHIYLLMSLHNLLTLWQKREANYSEITSGDWNWAVLMFDKAEFERLLLYDSRFRRHIKYKFKSFFVWLDLIEGDWNSQSICFTCCSIFLKIYIILDSRFLLQKKFNFLLIIFTVCQWKATSLWKSS